MEEEMNRTVQVNLTDSQKALVKRAADREGLSLSAWFRKTGLQAAEDVLGKRVE